MSVTAGFNQDEQGYLVAGGWSGTESKRRHHPDRPREINERALDLEPPAWSDRSKERKPFSVRPIDQTPPPRPIRPTTYQVNAGINALIRRAGQETWKPYRTKRTCRFTARDGGLVDGAYEFTRGDWVLQVPESRVIIVTFEEQALLPQR